LEALGIAWSNEGNAWAFPMYDGDDRVIGIRLRSESGKKWAVTGSRAGIFVPLEFATRRRIVICEGPTDTAAAMSLALAAIGRPSCSGGDEYIRRYCERAECDEVVIFADRDNVGRVGAEKLARELRIRTKIIAPHGKKDVREWVKSGATPSMARTLIDAANWWKP
jgi:5S rRNA maturation endonuclease (ribonuclease M5)